MAFVSTRWIANLCLFHFYCLAGTNMKQERGEREKKNASSWQLDFADWFPSFPFFSRWNEWVAPTTRDTEAPSELTQGSTMKSSGIIEEKNKEGEEGKIEKRRRMKAKSMKTIKVLSPSIIKKDKAALKTFKLLKKSLFEEDDEEEVEEDEEEEGEEDSPEEEIKKEDDEEEEQVQDSAEGSEEEEEEEEEVTRETPNLGAVKQDRNQQSGSDSVSSSTEAVQVDHKESIHQEDNFRTDDQVAPSSTVETSTSSNSSTSVKESQEEDNNTEVKSILPDSSEEELDKLNEPIHPEGESVAEGKVAVDAKEIEETNVIRPEEFEAEMTLNSNSREEDEEENSIHPEETEVKVASSTSSSDEELKESITIRPESIEVKMATPTTTKLDAILPEETDEVNQIQIVEDPEASSLPDSSAEETNEIHIHPDVIQTSKANSARPLDSFEDTSILDATCSPATPVPIIANAIVTKYGMYDLIFRL